jgi:hypothetical protein
MDTIPLIALAIVLSQVSLSDTDPASDAKLIAEMLLDRGGVGIALIAGGRFDSCGGRSIFGVDISRAGVSSSRST